MTEYIPVSSSAHLILLPNLLGWQLEPKESFIFDILVQLGTLVGVFAYFFSSLKDTAMAVMTGVIRFKPFHNEDARLGFMVMLASMPAAIVGLIFKDEIARYFSSPLLTCYSLMLTGIVLALADRFARTAKDEASRADAMIIGLAQSLALLPGISRSGATIAAGMARGLSRSNAARFSFFMSVPVMAGASSIALLELIKDRHALEHMTMPLFLGFLSSAISGYLVIKWFMRFLSKNGLAIFAVYCLVVGMAGAYFFN